MIMSENVYHQTFLVKVWCKRRLSNDLICLGSIQIMRVRVCVWEIMNTRNLRAWWMNNKSIPVLTTVFWAELWVHLPFTCEQHIFRNRPIECCIKENSAFSSDAHTQLIDGSIIKERWICPTIVENDLFESVVKNGHCKKWKYVLDFCLIIYTIAVDSGMCFYTGKF